MVFRKFFSLKIISVESSIYIGIQKDGTRGFCELKRVKHVRLWQVDLKFIFSTAFGQKQRVPTHRVSIRHAVVSVKGLNILFQAVFVPGCVGLIAAACYCLMWRWVGFVNLFKIPIRLKRSEITFLKVFKSLSDLRTFVSTTFAKWRHRPHTV